MFSERLLSWKDRSRDCTKVSILPSWCVRMVQASSVVRVDDSFPHQRHKEGHCSQLPNHKPLGRSGSGAQPKDTHPLRKLYRKKNFRAHTEKGFRLQSTIGWFRRRAQHWKLQHTRIAAQHSHFSQLRAFTKTSIPWSHL